ncbi:hypothetical protein SLAV_37205 [Streptomyces lavendulae subsp. lavendulae]|uniref:Uncharacterized protein n=1 Tax=Streptomyces lavendulae subsp. lavendulae TaxID=58340 RepID=A0A2K8PR22_STRLA|nr:hypothetical protein [Streptomyces lavendulae]ATZ29206.1 hypothetical protein SLAV_37205 [Streptomyces lavendulae subsp. lavendulae]QUQ59022.1 hypothetical protein SLLC_35365 [Streptomyces lavendulae subsp. lavendulae]
MTGTNSADKRRFLVLHDYGMGGAWWWVHARSARDVLETFAWVEVVTDPEAASRFEHDGLEEVDIEASLMPPGLEGLRAERDAQRGREGFGALADRDIVYLRRRWDEEDDEAVVHLMEVGSDGRRIRQVELAEGGTALRSGPDDWPFNPPIVDLFDPALADQEISRAEFEDEWIHAGRVEPDA